MQPNNSNAQPRQTPGKRRPRGNTTRAAAQRNYASENDILSDVALAQHYGGPDPYTPRKSVTGSPALTPAPTHPRTGKRSANKGRPKNVSTSPRPQKPSRSSPPHSAVAKATSATAFAGATFHASPAPSSLPIPTFFSKSMPDSPSVAAPASGEDSGGLSPSGSDSDTIEPPAQTAAAWQTARDESPLDIFFRADRAEKEKARRASSANVPMFLPGPFSPPSQPRSPAEPSTFPKVLSARPSGHLSAQRNSTQGISATELDGMPGKPMGPAFSTPYQERIKAARTTDRPAQRPPQVLARTQMPTPPASQDKSEALKKFLWGGRQTSPVDNGKATPQPLQDARMLQQASPCDSQPRDGPIASGARTSDADQPADLQAMENNLRRLLKLDLGLGPTPALTNARSP